MREGTRRDSLEQPGDREGRPMRINLSPALGQVCHAECNEATRATGYEILRFAQDDTREVRMILVEVGSRTTARVVPTFQWNTIKTKEENAF